MEGNFGDEKYYQKLKDQKFWFEFISEKQMAEKKEAWCNMVRNSMVDYFNIVKNQGHKPENHENFLAYLSSAAIFLTIHEPDRPRGVTNEDLLKLIN
jgi:hypothetical protein